MHVGQWVIWADPKQLTPYNMQANSMRGHVAWVIWVIYKALTQKTQSHFCGGLSARRVMGHLGHLAIKFKSPPYNIVTVHPYSICDILLSVVLYDLNDPKHSPVIVGAYVSRIQKRAPNS